MFQDFVMSCARDGIAATAEALFPVNDYGAPDFERRTSCDACSNI